MENDDLLADYDLTAWEVPPPSAGLADAVVRRAREPMPHVAPQPRSLRWWFIGGGALAAVAAVFALLMWGIERAPRDGSGDVVNGPSVLDLGTTSAAIDAGAQIAWSRRSNKIDARQSRGAATWTVSGDDKVTIDATVASIEASGASLRVEVEMNRSDVRAIGVGSAAAIVVSLVTVIVYEGHVKATSNGQTVNIQSGASMQFGTRPAPDQLNVGGSPQDAARIRELEAQVKRLENELANRDQAPRDKTTSCDPAPFLKKGDKMFAQGLHAASLVEFEKAIACEPSLETRTKALVAACQSKNMKRALVHYKTIPANVRKSVTTACVLSGIPIDESDEPTTSEESCDANALAKKGEDYLGQGMDTAALAQFERSLKCNYDADVVKKAFLASCRSKQRAKAKLYYSQLPPNTAPNYAQICIRYGIDVEEDVKNVTGGEGTILLNSKPRARVQLDGVTVGDTPLTMSTSPGKHKVTFTIMGDKYTFPITVKRGETTKMVKDFSTRPIGPDDFDTTP